MHNVPIDPTIMQATSDWITDNLARGELEIEILAGENQFQRLDEYDPQYNALETAIE